MSLNKGELWVLVWMQKDRSFEEMEETGAEVKAKVEKEDEKGGRILMGGGNWSSSSWTSYSTSHISGQTTANYLQAQRNLKEIYDPKENYNSRKPRQSGSNRIALIIIGLDVTD